VRRRRRREASEDRGEKGSRHFGDAFHFWVVS
jgi:hypothetical protein